MLKRVFVLVSIVILLLVLFVLSGCSSPGPAQEHEVKAQIDKEALTKELKKGVSEGISNELKEDEKPKPIFTDRELVDTTISRDNYIKNFNAYSNNELNETTLDKYGFHYDMTADGAIDDDMGVVNHIFYSHDITNKDQVEPAHVRGANFIKSLPFLTYEEQDKLIKAVTSGEDFDEVHYNISFTTMNSDTEYFLDIQWK